MKDGYLHARIGKAALYYINLMSKEKTDGNISEAARLLILAGAESMGLPAPEFTAGTDPKATKRTKPIVTMSPEVAWATAEEFMDARGGATEKADKARVIQILRSAGIQYREIGARLGISGQYVKIIDADRQAGRFGPELAGPA